MRQVINIQGQTVEYSVKFSRRAKRPRISVALSRAVTVTVPEGFGFFNVENFLLQKIQWLLKALNYFRRLENRPILKSNKKDYLLNRGPAKALATAKVEQWNKSYNFNYGRITIKNQKSRWGSCSKKGNLNFNYKIVHLPEHLVDYLVVHELCHLMQLNHSRDFWSLVSLTIPDFKKRRVELNSYITHG